MGHFMREAGLGVWGIGRWEGGKSDCGYTKVEWLVETRFLFFSEFLGDHDSEEGARKVP